MFQRLCSWTRCCCSRCTTRMMKWSCGHTRVIECFELFEMKANVSKFVSLVAAWGLGSKPITRQVARGRLKLSDQSITIKATTSVKYLGTKIDVGASAKKDVNARVQAAISPSVHPIELQHLEIRNPERKIQKTRRFGHWCCRSCCVESSACCSRSTKWLNWRCRQSNAVVRILRVDAQHQTNFG